MPNSITIFECDHLRPVYLREGQWVHILDDGRTGDKCYAGVYKVKAETETHTLDKLCLNSRDA